MPKRKIAGRGRRNHARLAALNDRFRLHGMSVHGTLTAAEPDRKILVQREREIAKRAKRKSPALSAPYKTETGVAEDIYQAVVNRNQ